jgi:hypothetical protein
MINQKILVKWIYMYKIDSRQLCLSREKEGFAENECVILEDQSF